MRDSFDVRTLSVELSDSLSLLELGEYAEDLIKTGRYSTEQYSTSHSTPLTFLAALSRNSFRHFIAFPLFYHT